MYVCSWWSYRSCKLALALAIVAVLAATGSTAEARDPACASWGMRTIASNLGVLENLEFDGRGGLLLSAWSMNAIERLTPAGGITPVALGVKAPGGQRLRGGVLYFNTGDSPESGYLGVADGTIQQLDLRTGERTTWASGLTMPNGLLFLPDGDAAVSRDLGTGTGITRIPAGDRGHPQANWVPTDNSNGMMIDPTGKWLYFAQTSQDGLPLMRARLSDPRKVERFASLGEGSGLDDMTMDRRGVLYVAVNRLPPDGEVIRFDPQTSETCVIASGLGSPSSVKFGSGPGWPSDRLYVVSFDGTVRELRPPPGLAAPLTRGGRGHVRVRFHLRRHRSAAAFNRRGRLRVTVQVTGGVLHRVELKLGRRKMTYALRRGLRLQGRRRVSVGRTRPVSAGHYRLALSGRDDAGHIVRRVAKIVFAP
jgi:hypothetical protein